MTAWVERDGKRYRLRARVDGVAVSLGSYATRAEADRLRLAYDRRASAAEVRHGLTLALWGETHMAARSARGVRHVDKDQARWAAYVERDPIGAIPLRDLRRRDVTEWRDRLLRRRAAQTVRNALNLLRSALADALDAELVAANVAGDVRVPRSATATQLEELAGVLSPDEALALLAVVPERWRAPVALALLTGLRWSELANLRWEDVRTDALAIRRSTKGRATKGGKPRVQPLLDAARPLLASLPRSGPLVLGGRDAMGQRPRAWLSWVTAAGITRRVRWHDLRHTCATALLAGWWGRQWTLEEVRAYLGHRSVQTTERYARLLDPTLARAVAGTTGAPLLPRAPEGADAESRMNHRSRFGDLNPRPAVYETAGMSGNRGLFVVDRPGSGAAANDEALGLHFGAGMALGLLVGMGMAA